MLTALVVIFVIAYAAIALEHPLKVNKSASALIGAGLLWTIYALSTGDHDLVNKQLGESLMGTAQIVFFLMGAMTIVEVVDAHNGFDVITSRIKTTRLTSLLWLVGFVTFFLSSVLDNLTTTIVMISLMKKLLDKHDDRLFFAGIIVIAANAGGAWTPIGDVTTTMLWIGGQITTLAIMKGVFLASMVNMVVPLAITSWFLRGTRSHQSRKDRAECGHRDKTTPFEQKLMFRMGIGILICVPIFKTVTHLPPFMGILFGLGILWLVGELLHSKKDDEAQGAPDPGAGAQADRHELHRLLHRHPAGGGRSGTHPYPDQPGRLAHQDRGTRGRDRHHHRPGQRHRRQRAAGGRLHGDVQPGPVPGRQLSSGSSWPTAPAPAARS